MQESAPGYKRKKFWSQFKIKYKTFFRDWFGDIWLYRKVNKSLRWLYKPYLYLFKNSSELWHKSKLTYIFMVIDVLLAVSTYIIMFVIISEKNGWDIFSFILNLFVAWVAFAIIVGPPFLILLILTFFICSLRSIGVQMMPIPIL